MSLLYADASGEHLAAPQALARDKARIITKHDHPSQVRQPNGALGEASGQAIPDGWLIKSECAL